MTNSAPNIGDIAPQLHLPTLDDHIFDLASLRGRSVIVSFLRHAG